jgi:hypothetical protein
MLLIYKYVEGLQIYNYLKSKFIATKEKNVLLNGPNILVQMK